MREKGGFLVSLEIHSDFARPIIWGTIEAEAVSVKNLSRQEHIRLYESLLGIRHYQANTKHRKQPYIDAAGRYVNAMDLADKDAQKMLNQAVEIEGKLYGKHHGQYYCFQRHHANYYHGYQNNDLDIHIRNKIDRKRWD